MTCSCKCSYCCSCNSKETPKHTVTAKVVDNKKTYTVEKGLYTKKQAD